jgi:DNA-binding NarL/FixJ family response regulator
MVHKKKVLIVDDHPLFREGLKVIIGRSPKFEVVGEAGTALEGLQRAKELKPDLALIDISLPDQSGVDLVRSIRSVLPETRVLVISMHSKMDYIAEAFRAGAMGYMVKESAGEGLLKALGCVAGGTYFLDSSVSHEVVSEIMRISDKKAKVVDATYRSLTAREQEIMRMLAEGLPAKEIADQLFISPKTVENHRTNLMNKLGLRSPLELARYAARIGLIDIDRWKD